MKVSAVLDVDVVAVETTDVVTVMLELAAPEAPDGVGRPPSCVVAVLDRSGSMGGERIEAAKTALRSIVDRMHSDDRLGVVVFDHSATLVLPAEDLAGSRRDRARTAVARISVGGSTDVGAGLMRGLQEARRAATETGATVILLSDGQANAGITSPDQLRDIVAGARQAQITTSTIGVGLGFDEELMTAIAQGGAGNASFAEHADGAAAAIAGEVDGLMSKTVQAATAFIRPGEHVTGIAVLSDVPSVAMAEGVSIDLADMYAGEQRRLLLQITVPERQDLGTLAIADIELKYVSLPDLVEHTVSLPICVNVVPGDQAAGRVPEPQVVQERLLLEVQEKKKRTKEHLSEGDIEAARAELGQALDLLACAPLPDSVIEEERTWVHTTSENLEEWDRDYTTKRLMSDFNKKGSGRRTRTQGGERPPVDPDSSA